MNTRFIEIMVGFFMLIGILALMVLALKVSGLANEMFTTHTYQVIALFDNVGDLKARAPVTIGGVKIGQVESISLDPETFKAKVLINIDEKENKIPEDSQASIYTAGLLGSNYIGLTPGFDTNFLHNHSTLNQTHSAVILEDLIGQFLYKVSNDDDTKKDKTESDIK